jgi:hypothetical protein
MKRAVVFAVCFAAVVGLVAAAGTPQTSPARAPHGCFPVRLSVQTNADELILRLTNMVPGVGYLVMTRTNRLFSTWLPFLSVINLGDTNAASFRINLRTGKSEEAVLFGGRNPGWMEHSIMEAARSVPAPMLPQMQFAAGSGEDADGDELPDLYEDLVTRTDPLNPDTANVGLSDGYQDADGDGWSNLQEWQSGTDPLTWNPPPPPSNLSARMQAGGGATVTWNYSAVTPPPFFTILRKPVSAPDSAWEVAARVKPVLNKYQQYEYVETNIGVFRSSVYRAYANYPAPPPWVMPSRCDAEGIRQTIRQVACVPATNGYLLTVARTVPRARYLMLVREGKNGFWKASGFFVGSTNGSPLKLLADQRGMLTTTSGPFALSKVEHVPNLEHPEFICGSGEDADGDGLPDIYEVLATKTDPDKSDTGATGLLDGYKDLAGDGWTALEKYRRRADPFAPDHTPGQVELTEPTMRDAMKAFWQAGQYDFKYDVKVETRTLNPRTEYQDLRLSWILLFPQRRPETVATNLQIRITVEMPEKKAPSHHVGGP